LLKKKEAIVSWLLIKYNFFLKKRAALHSRDKTNSTISYKKRYVHFQLYTFKCVFSDVALKITIRFWMDYYNIRFWIQWWYFHRCVKKYTLKSVKVKVHLAYLIGHPHYHWNWVKDWKQVACPLLIKFNHERRANDQSHSIVFTLLPLGPFSFSFSFPFPVFLINSVSFCSLKACTNFRQLINSQICVP